MITPTVDTKNTDLILRDRENFFLLTTVLPTGRNLGRKTQKWPHKILRPNFCQVCQKKGPNFS
jgi:hypothetical protein